MKHSSAFRFLSVLLSLTVVLVFNSCGGSGSGLSLDAAQEPQDAEATDTSRETLQPGQQIVKVKPQQPEEFGFGEAGARGVSFADPAGVLAQLPPPPKGASFTELELTREASDADSGGLAKNTSAKDTDMLFMPSWDFSGSNDINDLAFASYRFTLAGISQSLEAQSVRIEWNPGAAPESHSSVWVGFANWQSNGWDWFEGPDDPVLTIPSFSPYENANGEILMLLVLMGTTELRLDRLRVGALEIRGTGETVDPNAEIGNDAFIPPLDDSGPLPASFDISYGCGEVGNQGEVGSCTAWATGRGAFVYELGQLYQPCGWLIDEERHRPSPRYIYVSTDGGCPSEGRDTWSVMGFLKDNGAATEDKVGYGFPWLWGWFFDCDDDFDSDVENEAALFRISDRTRIFDIQNGKSDINEIKKMIAIYRKPLVMRVNLDDDFSDPDYEDGEVWTYNGDASGGHAMCVTGYDDAKQAFLVRNSWGDGWGDDGYCWISYATFNDSDANVDCYTMSLTASQALIDGYADHQPAVVPPLDFKATKGTDLDKVVLTWQGSGVVDLYDIYRGEELIASIPPASSYNDTTAEPGVAYMYKIRARATQFESGFATAVGYRADDPYIRYVGPLSGRSESLIHFSADIVATDPLSYEWDFGGGAEPNTSTEKAPGVVLKGNGIYHATLEVSNANGTAVYPFDLTIDPVQEEWAHTFGLSGDEQFKAVAVDNTGASYSVGVIDATPDKAVVAKYDAGGNLIWARQYTDNASNYSASCVDVDPSGDVLIGFGVASDVVAAKLDPDGNCLWTAVLANAQNFSIRGIASNSQGEVFATGRVSSNNNDIALLKFDSAGNLIWSKSWGAGSFDFGMDIAINSVDQVFVTGTSYLNATQENDIVLLQVNPADGSIIFQRAWGGTNDEMSPKLDVDLYGNVFISGTGSDLGVSDEEIVVIKHDLDNPLGSWSVAYAIPASNDEKTTSLGVCADFMGDVYVLGLMNGQQSGQRAHLLLKLDDEGALLREEEYLDPGWSALFDMAFSEARKLYVVGLRDKRHTPFWDPGLSGEGTLHNPNLTVTDLAIASADYAASGAPLPGSFADIMPGGVVDNGAGADDLYIVKFNPEVEN